MASDVYLQIKGIDGDSTDTAHPKWIEVQSYSTGVSMPMDGNKTKGTRATGKANFADFTVSKSADSTSPQLAFACASGQHFDEVTVDMCRNVNNKQEIYMRYIMKDVVISSYSNSGASSGGEPMETITFDYAEIQWNYTPGDVKGKNQAAMKKGWSLAKNAAAT